MNDNDERLEQFRTAVDDLKLKGASGLGERRLLVAGVVLAAIGVALGALGAIQVGLHGDSPADQRAYMAQGSLFGLAFVIVGVGLFVRYSLARYLRFWLVRLTYESRANTDRIVEAIERNGVGPGPTPPPSPAPPSD